MSYVTDVTVILTDWHDKARFEALVQKHEGFTPDVAETSGTKCPGSYAYALGLNYASVDLIEAVVAGPWAAGTVVFIHVESWDRPQVKVFGPKPTGGWADTPNIVL